MDWIGGIGGLVLGWLKLRGELKLKAAESERWFHSVMQLTVTSWVALISTWGLFGLGFLGLGDVLTAMGLTSPVPLPTLPPFAALVAGFFCGLLAAAGAVLRIWKADPLLRTIPLWSPQAAVEMELSQPGTLTEGKPEEKEKP